MSWIERWLDRIFPYTVIAETDCEAYRQNIEAYKNPYLKRYFILGKHHGARIYLHKIITSDPGRDLHDHPFDFLSIILWGGYVEETYTTALQVATQKKRKYPGMILWRPAQWTHRLILDRPAWTLVFRSRKKRDWGFHT